ncbi:Hsp20/alpha crystallin family protein [Aequorivita sp. F47161]|jgi:HSP20 family protein|uniref:Hsp20/alpha crystallin family protein n=1 Tax=Aequorivita vitellina TaxID=2874475 RepID=A0A9X1U2Z3_9FLAO|nr:Hsp20/alpha crystallin family protein [Aequorivita vitellina]MCG2420395.1 Hsp20/alpha crystallin family protein [Aequorivita vitellina]MCZ4317803.1 Hsp20/alpha crystallin family protein [Aequorivita viscosa]
MSTLMNVPKNGGLTRTTNSGSNLSPWTSLIDDIFNREMSSVFSQNFNTGISLPKVNIKESADAYYVEMAAPGLKKSDFQIDLDNQLLTISTEVEEKNEENKENFTRREFGYSSFKRSFSLPETVEDSKIKAQYKEGILSIHLPKKEEARQKPPRNIQIS